MNSLQSILRNVVVKLVNDVTVKKISPNSMIGIDKLVIFDISIIKLAL